MTAARKIRLGFWLITLIPVILAVVTIQNANRLVDASADVARTNELVKKLENFLSRLKDLEVSQREYILTGDETYVREIEAARSQISADIASLEKMQQPDRHWVELLRTLILQKFDEIRKTMELRRSGDVEAASRLALTQAEGSRPMDDLRQLIRTMIRQENENLGERSRLQNRKFVNTMALFAVVVLLNLVLIWSLFHHISNESSRFRRMNEELEARVAERTAELARSNEELQQFAYMVSHDLKEPMRMISSYSSLLERRYHGKLDEDADTYIGFIVGGVRRMNALISDLLDYSSAGRGDGSRLQEVDSAAVYDGVIENLRVTINECGAEVTRGDLPTVTCDPVRLSQVFQNLLSNALKYCGTRQPKVHVSATLKKDNWEFAVRDNGVGIPPGKQAQIFGLFSRLHGKDVEGTGIGLATVKKIVEQHGGRIWVESVPGEGSTFRFTVPLVQHPPLSATTS